MALSDFLASGDGLLEMMLERELKRNISFELRYVMTMRVLVTRNLVLCSRGRCGELYDYSTRHTCPAKCLRDWAER